MMWILPKQLHTSPYVLDMAELISDLNEQSQTCEQSLLVRSKPTLARTWLRKWKKDSWTQHLSGRILKPSLGATFVERWTSCLADTLVSPSQPLESDLEKTTQDISGLILQMELDLCNLDYASSKTWKVISPLDFEKLSKNWKALVIKQRGEYSQRQKLVRHTEESESSLWPTPCAMEAQKAGNYSKGQMGKSLVAMGNRGELTLPTPTVNDTTSPSHEIELHNGVYRCKHSRKPNSPWFGARLKDVAKMWPTPRAANPGSRPNGKGGKVLAEEVKKFPTTKNWATPCTMDVLPPKSEKALMKERLQDRRNRSQPGNLRDQVAVAEGISYWPTTKVNYSTPTARMWKDTGTMPAEFRRNTPSLAIQVGGKLNADWVEWLMGIPIGWTDCDCAAMGLSQQLPH